MFDWLRNLFRRVVPKRRHYREIKVGKLGPVHIHIVGVRGERLYESNINTAEEVKTTISEAINVSTDPRSKDPNNIYPRVYIDDQLWIVGDTTYDDLLSVVYRIANVKRNLAKKTVLDRNAEIKRCRMVLCYAKSYFDTGVDTMRNMLLVPSENYNFVVQNLSVKQDVIRDGIGATRELISSLLNNEQYIYDARKHEKGEYPTMLDFAFTTIGREWRS